MKSHSIYSWRVTTGHWWAPTWWAAPVKTFWHDPIFVSRLCRDCTSLQDERRINRYCLPTSQWMLSWSHILSALYSFVFVFGNAIHSFQSLQRGRRLQHPRTDNTVQHMCVSGSFLKRRSSGPGSLLFICSTKQDMDQPNDILYRLIVFVSPPRWTTDRTWTTFWAVCVPSHS